MNTEAELRAALQRIVFEGLTHDGRLIPSDALRDRLLEARAALSAPADAPAATIEASAPAGTWEEAAERDEDYARMQMADILTRTANALRGEPPTHHRWSWHDLPERAAVAIAAIDAMQRDAACASAGWRREAADADEVLRAARATGVSGRLADLRDRLGELADTMRAALSALVDDRVWSPESHLDALQDRAHTPEEVRPCRRIKSEPLTEKQIDALYEANCDPRNPFAPSRKFFGRTVRATEHAHRIGTAQGDGNA